MNDCQSIDSEDDVDDLEIESIYDTSEILDRYPNIISRPCGPGDDLSRVIGETDSRCGDSSRPNKAARPSGASSCGLSSNASGSRTNRRKRRADKEKDREKKAEKRRYGDDYTETDDEDGAQGDDSDSQLNLVEEDHAAKELWPQSASGHVEFSWKRLKGIFGASQRAKEGLLPPLSLAQRFGGDWVMVRSFNVASLAVHLNLRALSTLLTVVPYELTQSFEICTSQHRRIQFVDSVEGQCPGGDRLRLVREVDTYHNYRKFTPAGFDFLSHSERLILAGGRVMDDSPAHFTSLATCWRCRSGVTDGKTEDEWSIVTKFRLPFGRDRGIASRTLLTDGTSNEEADIMFRKIKLVTGPAAGHAACMVYKRTTDTENQFEFTLRRVVSDIVQRSEYGSMYE